MIDQTARRRAEKAHACLICGWLLLVGLLIGTPILLMKGAKW